MKPKITPIGRTPTPQPEPIVGAQKMPQLVWHLHADDRNTGQVQRPAMVFGQGSEEGTLNLMVFRSETFDDSTGIEEVQNVPYVQRAHLEDWGPGRRYCCSDLLPPRPQPEPEPRPTPPPRAERPPQPARGRTAPRGAVEPADEGGGGGGGDEIDAFLTGASTRRR